MPTSLRRSALPRLLLTAAALLSGCSGSTGGSQVRGDAPEDREGAAAEGDHESSARPVERIGERTDAAPPLPEGRAEAVFAGGCFWCMEGPFEAIPGVDSVVSGYTGGELEGPSYEEIGAHMTQHAEAVRVVYDPSRVAYEQLLEVFWHNVDPTQREGQFCDRGHQYRTGIFVRSADERRLAEASKARIAQQLGAAVVTEITDASTFWVAEAYHQDFHRTNPAHYTRYRAGCGRDRRLQQLWGEHAGH